jgi:hypothetical protein
MYLVVRIPKSQDVMPLVRQYPSHLFQMVNIDLQCIISLPSLELIATYKMLNAMP